MPQIKDTELQKISLIKKDALELASALGEIHYQKTLLDLQIDSIKQKIVSLRKEEDALFSELTSIYGNINVNLETGEYTTV